MWRMSLILVSWGRLGVAWGRASAIPLFSDS